MRNTGVSMTCCMCVMQGVFEFLEKQGKALTPVGLQVVLHGQVPTGEQLTALTITACRKVDQLCLGSC